MYSFYEWPSMDDQLLESFCTVARSLFEDIILIQDLCHSIEQSCLPESNQQRAKEQFDIVYNGVNTLFKLGKVSNLHHQEQLEDLTYHIIETTRDLNFSLEERAKFICDAWQEKVLSFT